MREPPGAGAPPPPPSPVRAAVWLGCAGLLASLWAGRPDPGPAPSPTPPPEASAAARLLWGERLDLHRASAADLEVLPGIGPARAAAIVEARCRRPFADPADLERVHGIGPRTTARLVRRVEVGDPVPEGCEPAAAPSAAGSPEPRRAPGRGDS